MDKYSEALERAKQGLPIDEIFPELKESRDERIRKAIKEAISSYWTDVTQAIEDCIAWLEKHKYTEEDMDRAYKCADEVQYKRGYEAAIAWLEKHGEQNHTVEEVDNLHDYLYGEQKPAEWSEEDEKEIVMCCKFLHDASQCIDYDVSHKEDIVKCIQWLKSLKTKNHDKPTEEEMSALEKFVYGGFQRHC